MRDLHNYTRYYFLGIGGIGMSALARYFHRLGKSVIGYDRRETPLTQCLIQEGISVHYQDEVAEIPVDSSPENTLVVYTPALPEDVSEYVYFKEKQFSLVKRSQVLGAITKKSHCIAVAGTHGKTTTSALIAHILMQASFPVTSFVGGILENYQSNFIFNGNEYTVVEADEYDRSFLQLHPQHAIVTSVDADHLDIYGDAEELVSTFQAFAEQVKETVFVAEGINMPKAKTYAAERKADYRATNLRVEQDRWAFDFESDGISIQGLSLLLPGRHNIENATAAIALALSLGISPEQIKEALASFQGIKRRFSRVTLPSGKVLIDDYAHHPSEIRATLEATRRFYPNKKILAVFQPHLYSRTRDFEVGFAEELAKVDRLLLLDIYPAREQPIEGVTAENLAKKIPTEVSVCSLDKAIEMIKEQSSFDVFLLMGAGSIDTLYKPLQTIGL